MKTMERKKLELRQVLECARRCAALDTPVIERGLKPDWTRRVKGTLTKAVQRYRTPRRWRAPMGATQFRQVLEYAKLAKPESAKAGPLAFWIFRAGRSRVSAIYDSFERLTSKAVEDYRTPGRWRAFACVLVMLAFGLTIGNAAEPAKTDLPALLQKGLFEEEVNRNFEAAITEYRAALAQFDRQRNYGATALFRLAECLRKTGRKAEADALYRRVIQEFPDQTNLVQLSHTHLGTTPGLAKVEGTTPTPELDEETKEIQRIAAMVKDSPDLINAAQGGTTPLHLAAARGQLKVATYLLDHGAIIDCQAGSTVSALSPNTLPGSTPLIMAAQAGHKTMVELLVKRGASVEAVDRERKTALHWAARKGYKGVTEVLLAAKAPLQTVDSLKNTPLALAVENNHGAIVAVLLAHRAEVNKANHTDDTPLHLAVKGSNVELAKMLLAAKADIHAKNNQGETPLHLAAGGGHLAMITLLCEAGARVNEADNRGFTPLLLAIRQSEEAVDLLLRFKADPNLEFQGAYPFSGQNRFPQFTSQFPTPLIFGIGHIKPAALSALIKSGANINARDRNDCTALYWAVYSRQTNLIDWLLSSKADPNIAHRDGTTPLHLAAANGYPEVVRWLLDYKAEINAQDREGQTALYVATNKRFKEVVTLLLERGADAMLATKDGTTPMDLAGSTGVGPLPPPGRAITPILPPIGAPGQPSSPTFTPVRGSAEELQEILRKHGVSLLTPRPGMITVCRASTNQKSFVMPENTNGWNRLTLLEIIADDYARPNNVHPRPLPFPDWEQVRIFRRAMDGKTREIPVNVNEIFNGKAKDVLLEWGDIVDIPEKPHLASEQWTNLTTERDSLKRMLERTVVIQTKNMTNQVKWMPFEQAGPAYGDIKGGPWLSQFLRVRKALYLATSDLARIKVKRIDPSTGKVEEYVVDATKPHDPRTDLWLRDGDEIIIPEKAF